MTVATTAGTVRTACGCAPAARPKRPKTCDRCRLVAEVNLRIDDLKAWRRRFPGRTIRQRHWLAERMREGLGLRDTLRFGGGIFMPFTQVEADVEDWLAEVETRLVTYRRLQSGLSLGSLATMLLLVELLFGWQIFGKLRGFLAAVMGRESAADFLLATVVGVLAYTAIDNLVAILSSRYRINLRLFSVVVMIGLIGLLAPYVRFGSTEGGFHLEFFAAPRHAGFFLGLFFAALVDAISRLRAKLWRSRDEDMEPKEPSAGGSGTAGWMMSAGEALHNLKEWALGKLKEAGGRKAPAPAPAAKPAKPRSRKGKRAAPSPPSG